MILFYGERESVDIMGFYVFLCNGVPFTKIGW